MRNILRIWKTDLRHLFANTVATIVTLGLIIVPPMYAWLTTLGFWDPYDDTGGLKVAVADADAGYTSALFPARIDIGDSITAKLHENDQFDWVFCSEDEVEEGVRSGEFYAGIVIQAEFSEDFMSVLTTDERTPKIIYYVNQKENAIASHVTAAGTSVLKDQIDETFAKTISEVMIAVMHDLTEFMDGDSIASYGGRLLQQLDEAQDALDACLVESEGIEGALSVMEGLISSASGVLDGASGIKAASDEITGDAASSIMDGASALEEADSATANAIGGAASSLDGVQQAADSVFQSAKEDPAHARQLAEDALALVHDVQGVYSDARSALQAAGATADSLTSLDLAISSLGQVADDIQAAMDSASGVQQDADAAQAQMTESLDEARANMEALKGVLQGDLSNRISALADRMSSLSSSADGLASAADAAAVSLKAASDGLSIGMSSAKDSLSEATSVLAEAKAGLQASTDQLSQALQSGDLDQLRRIVGGNAGELSTFLSAPTKLVQHAVYEVKTNGDSMSPFYSCLSLWVGAIFCVALMSADPSKKLRAKLDHPKSWQLYLGRYGAFCFIALLQAVVLLIGNLLFIGIECAHPILYALSLILCSIVFSNLVFTLDISFGNIGKAIAIILLVMQLAGTGGIMPIQTSAPIFQAIYPWLPFTHAISALSSCMAGIYGNQLIISLALLAAFLVPSLLLGLALRNPMIRLNGKITEKLDATKLL